MLKKIKIWKFEIYSNGTLSFYKGSRKPPEIGIKHYTVYIDFLNLGWWKDLFTNRKNLYSSCIVSTVHPDIEKINRKGKK